MTEWLPNQLHRAYCDSNSYNAGDCDCDGPEVQAEVERLRAAVDRVREMCDYADSLPGWASDAFNVDTASLRDVLGISTD